jgi:PAS domain S-box-containing protein
MADDRSPSRHALADSADRDAGEDDLAYLLDALAEGAIVSRDGFILFANRSALRTLGHKRNRELFWRHTEEVIHPSERPPVAQRLAALQERGREVTPLEPFELRLLRRTGQLVPVEARMVSITFEGAPAVLLLLRDLSERRRMEQQLQFADRMASVGTLAAGVAHEINNPLTYVLGNMEMMAEQLADPTQLEDPEVRAELVELLAEARDGAERVQSIVRELRTFARRPAEQRMADVDLPRVVESVTRMATNELKHRARLVKEIGETPRVRANPQQLHQVLLNLLVNAAQAIEIGDVNTNQVRLTTGVDASGSVLVEVADTGCGIEPAQLDRIFDPFFTTKEPGVGSGLGLWICHSMVTSLGGTIAIDSIVGRGTTVRITLPAAGTGGG